MATWKTDRCAPRSMVAEAICRLLYPDFWPFGVEPGPELDDEPDQ